MAGDPDAGKFKIADIKEIIKIPSFWLLAVMLLFVTSMVFFAFMVTYFVNVRGWETPAAAVLYTVFMAGWAVGGFTRTLGDFFQKKFGDKGRVMFMQIYLISWAIGALPVHAGGLGQGPGGLHRGLPGRGDRLVGLLRRGAADGRPDCGAAVAATTFALLFSFIQARSQPSTCC